MVLVPYTPSPFTMSTCIRLAQTRMMVLMNIHGFRSNAKLKAILEGCANLSHLWRSTVESHALFMKGFLQPNAAYFRFTHVVNMQPKFYMGSAAHSTLDREHIRTRKCFQLEHDKLAQAELALRFWRDYRCLELALIQEWQPRLNYLFICQFFHPRKGILKKPAMNTNAQFGLASLWRKAKHKFTPKVVRDILASNRFQSRLDLWQIIHALGSNTKARFETTKMLRSNDGGLTLCYMLRRLGSNIQEPYRTLSLQAIDASIRWWKRKHAPRASALRAPWGSI